MNTSMRQRGGRSSAERAVRSRLCQWIQRGEFVHGSLIRMARACGNPGCRCRRGRKHVSWYVAVSRQGRKRMVYLSPAWEGRVKAWVGQYQAIRQGLEELSELQWQKIRRRQE